MSSPLSFERFRRALVGFASVALMAVCVVLGLRVGFLLWARFAAGVGADFFVLGAFFAGALLAGALLVGAFLMVVFLLVVFFVAMSALLPVQKQRSPRRAGFWTVRLHVKGGVR